MQNKASLLCLVQIPGHAAITGLELTAPGYDLLKRSEDSSPPLMNGGGGGEGWKMRVHLEHENSCSNLWTCRVMLGLRLGTAAH